MSEWGISTYGDPCGECGFSWSISRADLLTLVTNLTERCGEILDGVDGGARHPDLGWPAVAYVCHVTDNLRVFAERFAAVANGAKGPLPGYDPDELARVKQYDRAHLPAALWSLGRAAADWVAAAGLAMPDAVVFHEERGSQSVLDMMRASAHDAYHHAHDLQRIARV